MFGIFKSKEKRICDVVGKIIHTQISLALKENKEVFNRPEEIVFFSQYLTYFIWNIAANFNAVGKWTTEEEYKKYICEGVIPGRLWEIYQRYEAMKELSESAGFDMKSIEELAVGAAVYDALHVDRNPDGLYRYLTNKDVKTYE